MSRCLACAQVNIINCYVCASPKLWSRVPRHRESTIHMPRSHVHTTQYYAPTNAGLLYYESYIKQNPADTQARQEVATAFIIETGIAAKTFPMLGLRDCVLGIKNEPNSKLNAKAFANLVQNGVLTAADKKSWLRKLNCAEMLAIKYLLSKKSPKTAPDIFDGANALHAPRDIEARYVKLISSEERPRKKSFRAVAVALENLCAEGMLKRTEESVPRTYEIDKEKFVEVLYFTDYAAWKQARIE